MLFFEIYLAVQWVYARGKATSVIYPSLCSKRNKALKTAALLTKDIKSNNKKILVSLITTAIHES